MSKLQWDNAGQRFYHNGISKVILFPTWDATNKRYTGGVAWNGITGIDESPDGGDSNDLWADNIKYGSIRGTENLKGSISAYQWPSALDELDSKVVSNGIVIGQQKRNKRFGLCYRTEIGTDANPNAGYQLHFLYDVMLSPSDKSYETVNDSPDATEFSWDFECLPQKQTYNRPPKPDVTDVWYYDRERQTYDVKYDTIVSSRVDIVPGTSGDKYAIKKIPVQRKDEKGNVITYLERLVITQDFPDNLKLACGYEMVTDTSDGPYAHRIGLNLIQPQLTKSSRKLYGSTLSTCGIHDMRAQYENPVTPNNTTTYMTSYITSHAKTATEYDPITVSIDELKGLLYLSSETVNSIRETRTISSITIDSRYTSTAKLAQINSMIENTGCSMPRLSDLFE